MSKTMILALSLGMASFGYSQSSASAGMNSDQSFLKQASEANMAEVDLGRLAQKNASSQMVKTFGERMVTDHTHLEQQAREVANKTGTTLPSSEGVTNRAQYTRLAAKSGAEFDRAYITDMIKDHQHDIAAFEKEAQSGTNPEIKEMASKALPTLQEHLRLAENAARQIGISPTGSGL